MALDLTGDQQTTLGMVEWSVGYIREKLHADDQAYEELMTDVLYELPVEIVGRMTRLRKAIKDACLEADRLEDFIKSQDPDREEP